MALPAPHTDDPALPQTHRPQCHKQACCDCRQGTWPQPTSRRPRTLTFAIAASAWDLHQRHQSNRKHNPEGHEAWIRTLNAFLQPGGDPDAHTRRLLSQVSDAVAGTTGQGGHWGPGTWPTLLARSHRWHTAMFRTRFPSTGRGSWKSALPTHEDGRYTITPLTTSAALQRAGHEMQNCLASYSGDCRQGRSRVFLISHTGAPDIVAAVHLYRLDQAWHLGQVEATDQTKPQQQGHGRRPPPAKTLPGHHRTANRRTAPNPGPAAASVLTLETLSTFRHSGFLPLSNHLLQ